jgi:hypothetical protein
MNDYQYLKLKKYMKLYRLFYYLSAFSLGSFLTFLTLGFIPQMWFNLIMSIITFILGFLFRNVENEP